MSWRDACRPMIAEVVRKYRDQDGKLTVTESVIRKELREVYPWGERKYHPYKIWCDEINVQLGKKSYGSRKFADSKNPGQKELF
jgi:hypothetical protein